MRWDAESIHSAVSWSAVLKQLGIDETCLRDRHGPCPMCGGEDRFRFDDLNGRGTWFCNQCGNGDGFALLRRIYGWTFAEARREVMRVAGLKATGSGPVPARRPRKSPTVPPHEPA